MSDVLAPLVALVPAHAAFVAVAVGGHRPIRPLIWNEWTQSTTPTPIQNTAVNRSMDESEPLPQIDRVDGIAAIAHAQSMRDLAAAMQHAKAKTNEAHALFLANQEQTLAEYARLHAKLHRLFNEH